jgi:hypothetical protein
LSPISRPPKKTSPVAFTGCVRLWQPRVTKSSTAVQRPGFPCDNSRAPTPRSDEMTPCIPEYLRLPIADPFALMPPRDPNDDDDDDDDEDEDDDEEDDEDDNDKNAVPMT